MVSGSQLWGWDDAAQMALQVARGLAAGHGEGRRAPGPASFRLRARDRGGVTTRSREPVPPCSQTFFFIHPITATRWTKLVARDWHAFVATQPGHTAAPE